MRAPWLDDGDVRLYAGDCVEVMRELEAESVDAVCTDPPYGLSFMGKAWDGSAIEHAAREDAERRRDLGPHSPTRPGREAPRSSSAFGPAAGQAGAYDFSLTGNRAFQAWCETWAREAVRVLKPGGHLLAAGSSRTFHRLVCAIEDAGFEVRDTITHHYGSGFPKSLDVSKAIDREAGAEREVVGAYHGPDGKARDTVNNWRDGQEQERRTTMLTAPATPEASAWQGWGTALKPATEFWTVARKPLAERTVARQVLATGTGALHIDACRVAMSDEDRTVVDSRSGAGFGVNGWEHQGRAEGRFSSAAAGRFPPNLLLTHDAACEDGGACAPGCPVGELDAQSGWQRDGVAVQRNRDGEVHNAVYGPYAKPPVEDAGYGGAGGASRFYPTFRYEAKASGADRGEGNTHPTVKPLALMRWLCRLVTPPGGTVLDPFAGSGTTLLAAREEGFRAIGIEREAEYLAMAAHRLRQLSLFAGTA